MKLWVLLTIDEDDDPAERVRVFGTEPELIDETALLLTTEVEKLERKDPAHVVNTAPVKDALRSRRIRSALDRWDELGVTPLAIRWLVVDFGTNEPSKEVEEVRESTTAQRSKRRLDRAHERLLNAARAYARALDKSDMNPEKQAEELARAALAFNKADRPKPLPRRPTAS